MLNDDEMLRTEDRKWSLLIDISLPIYSEQRLIQICFWWDRQEHSGRIEPDVNGYNYLHAPGSSCSGGIHSHSHVRAEHTGFNFSSSSSYWVMASRKRPVRLGSPVLLNSKALPPRLIGEVFSHFSDFAWHYCTMESFQMRKSIIMRISYYRSGLIIMISAFRTLKAQSYGNTIYHGTV